jgi:hypothetical protein
MQESLDLAIRLMATATWRMAMASAQVEALRAQVEATKGVMESAAILLAGLHQRLVEAAGDPVAVEEITADLATTSVALADAVAANP